MIGWHLKKHFSLRNQEEELRQQQVEIRLQELMGIGKQCAAHLRPSMPATEYGEMLYNAIGMPAEIL